MFWKYAPNLQENNHAEKKFYQDHTSIQRIFNYLKVKEYALIYISSDSVGILQSNCFTKYQIDHVFKIFEKYLWMSSILVKVHLQPVALLKIELFYRYFSFALNVDVKQQFCGTSSSCCFQKLQGVSWLNFDS